VPRTGNTEWLNVLVQGNRRAKCPFCQGWHVLGEDLLPGSTGTCDAVYARSTKVAISVRQIEDGKLRKPTKAEVKKAVDHAWSRR